MGKPGGAAAAADASGLAFEVEAQLSRRTAGAQSVGEVERGSGGGGGSGVAGWKSTQGEQASSFVEAEACAEVAGCGADDAAAQGGVEGAETIEFYRDGGLAGRGADGAASAAYRFAGE